MTLGFQETLKYRWLIFGILALHFLLVYFHRVSTAVVAQDLVKDFHISGTALGILSSSYFYTYAIMQLPIGFLADSWGPRKALLDFLNLFPFFGGIVFQLLIGYILDRISRTEGVCPPYGIQKYIFVSCSCRFRIYCMHLNL
jgi:MFS family permease